jgi:hypothetical protein
MTRQRFGPRLPVWIVFAVLVGVPSAQLTRLLREERASVQPAGEPRSATVAVLAPALPPTADDPRDDAFRYDLVGPSTAPIAAAAISPSGRLVAVLDDSGEVTIWDVKDRRRVNRFDTGHRMPMRRLYPSAAPMALKSPRGRALRAMWFSPHARTLVVLEDGEKLLRELELP